MNDQTEVLSTTQNYCRLGNPSGQWLFGLAERRARSMKDSFHVEDIYDQLGSLREQVQELAASAGKSARWQYGRARNLATEAAEEACQARHPIATV
jgi:hypothetical protein